MLARVLVHIPDKGHITTRDDGWYANRPRGMRERAEPAAANGPPAIVPVPRRAPTDATRRRAALLQQIFEVDPLGCPTCRGAMRLVAVITLPSVIDQILTHLRTRATAIARRLVLVRSVVASYALPTPIEIPIPTPNATPACPDQLQTPRRPALSKAGRSRHRAGRFPFFAPRSTCSGPPS